MTKIVVTGGTRLEGEIRLPGAKNAVLPILAATLLTEDEITLHDCPHLSDVDNMIEILRCMGCKVKWEQNSITVDASSANSCEMPEHLAKELRSSIFLMGPVLGRFRKARLSFPGGCEIGNRPIDLHLGGISALNAKISEKYGFITCDGTQMRGAGIHLDYPSVGATENIMMAAATLEDTSVIYNAAREPEIVDLQNFLVRLGARISGAGSSTIVIEGVKSLSGGEYTIMPDRIAAGTVMTAAAITGGDVTVKNAFASQLSSVIAKLGEAGCEIDVKNGNIRTRAPQRPREIKLVETLPHPGFPTDMQAQIVALCAVASGTSVVVENVFENRFKHVPELVRMGASITLRDRTAIVRGVDKLTGAAVTARDLRGGAALVLAGLRAEGETSVDNAWHIDRGYERIETLMSTLGANITREQ
jgi:UDP-N-acetylglucosamine 1-carboxyvinyltransferase